MTKTSKATAQINFNNRRQFDNFVDFKSSETPTASRSLVKTTMAAAIPNEDQAITYKDILDVARTLQDTFKTNSEGGFETAAQTAQGALQLMSKMPGRYPNYLNATKGRYF